MRLTVGQTVYLYLHATAGTKEADGTFSTISQGAAATVITFFTPEYPGQYCIQVKVQGSTSESFLVSEAEVKDWDSMTRLEREMQYAVAELQVTELR